MNPLAIEAQLLQRRFGATRAVDGVELRVAAGELFGLVGPDGAGKSTLLRLLAGLLQPDGGRFNIFGRPLQGAASARRALIGLMPQQASLYGDLTVAENVDFFGQLHCLPRALREERAAALLELTELKAFAHRRAGALSGGMYKKLALACALVHAPPLLLLDEPTSGVDPLSRRELWTMLNALVSAGTTVVVATSVMQEAEGLGRVGLMHHGRLITVGSPQELIAAMRAEVYEFAAGAAHVVAPLMERAAGVISWSATGEGVRVVLAPGGAATWVPKLNSLGVQLARVAANFEDLFMATLTERAP